MVPAVMGMGMGMVKGTGMVSIPRESLTVVHHGYCNEWKAPLRIHPQSYTNHSDGDGHSEGDGDGDGTLSVECDK